MRLSHDLIQLFRDDGYALVRGLIPADLTASVRNRTMEVGRGEHDWGDGPFQVADPEQYRREDGGMVPIGIQGPANQEDVFKQMAEHPNLQSAMSQILGGEVQLFTDQIAIKHKFLTQEQGGRSYYHQDSDYWHIEPELGCNCWIPLDEVDRQSIALAVIPGSQRGWKIFEHEHYFDDPPLCSARNGQAFKRKRIPLDQVDDSNEVIFPMSPGDGLFFTNYTWHRSEPNRSGEDKAFYAIAYQLTEEAVQAKRTSRTA